MPTPDDEKDNGENPFANPTTDPPPHDTSVPEQPKAAPAQLPIEPKHESAKPAAGGSFMDRVREKPMPFVGGGVAILLVCIGGIVLATCGGGKTTADDPALSGTGAALGDAAVTTPPPEPTATAEPTTQPTGRRGCQDGELVCSDDGKELFLCNNGRLMLTYKQCRGPKGCVTKEGKAVCDQSVAEDGDMCLNHGKFACSADTKSQFICSSGTFMRVRNCIHKGCNVVSPLEVTCD